MTEYKNHKVGVSLSNDPEADAVPPLLLKHWRGALNINYSWKRSAYHAVMYTLLSILPRRIWGKRYE